MNTLSQAEKKKVLRKSNINRTAFLADTPEQMAAILKIIPAREGKAPTLTESEIITAFPPDPTADRKLLIRDLVLLQSARFALSLVYFSKYKQDDLGVIDTAIFNDMLAWGTGKEDRCEEYPTYIQSMYRDLATRLGKKEEYDELLEEVRRWYRPG